MAFVDEQNWQALAREAGFKLPEWDTPTPLRGVGLLIHVLLKRAGFQDVGHASLLGMGPERDLALVILFLTHEGVEYNLSLETTAHYKKRHGLEEE